MEQMLIINGKNSTAYIKFIYNDSQSHTHVRKIVEIIHNNNHDLSIHNFKSIDDNRVKTIINEILNFSCHNCDSSFGINKK